MGKENKPLVTVIVPSYNHEKYITQCIDSIMNQTYKNIELIVIDDGSKDNSSIILNQLKLKYNFKLIFQNNVGVAATLNRGIKEFARGEYVTFCASDDYWLKEKLELQVDFMELNKNIPLCFGKSIVVDELNRTNIRATERINLKLKGGNIFKEILLIKFHPPVNYLFRTSIFPKVGYYKEGIWAEDFYMNCKISENYEIGFINDFISYYRINNNIENMNTMAAYSHLKTINEFNYSQYFDEALVEWNYRFFCWFSCFKKYKIESIKAAIASINNIYKKSYIKALLKLIIHWK